MQRQITEFFSERKKIICFESLIKNKSELIYNFVILNYIKKILHDMMFH